MTKTPESFVSGGAPVPIETFVPAASVRRRAVLVLHGSAGLGPEFRADIVSFAEALESQGIAAAIPHYFAANPPKS